MNTGFEIEDFIEEDSSEYKQLLTYIDNNLKPLINEFHSYYYQRLKLGESKSPFELTVMGIYKTIPDVDWLDGLGINDHSNLIIPLVRFSSFDNRTKFKFKQNINEKWIPFDISTYKIIRDILTNARHALEEKMSDPWRQGTGEAHMWYKIIYEEEFMEIEFANKSKSTASEVRQTAESKKRYENIRFEELGGDFHFENRSGGILITRVKIKYL